METLKLLLIYFTSTYGAAFSTGSFWARLVAFLDGYTGTGKLISRSRETYEQIPQRFDLAIITRSRRGESGLSPLCSAHLPVALLFTALLLSWCISTTTRANILLRMRSLTFA